TVLVKWIEYVEGDDFPQLGFQIQQIKHKEVLHTEVEHMKEGRMEVSGKKLDFRPQQTVDIDTNDRDKGMLDACVKEQEILYTHIYHNLKYRWLIGICRVVIFLTLGNLAIWTISV
ncbi:hypothetical protein ACJX0J_008555, partial [Zea mays]